jgi:hypothetical protein
VLSLPRRSSERRRVLLLVLLLLLDPQPGASCHQMMSNRFNGFRAPGLCFRCLLLFSPSAPRRFDVSSRLTPLKSLVCSALRYRGKGPLDRRSREWLFYAEL